MNTCNQKIMDMKDFTAGDLVSLWGEERGKASKWFGEVVEKDEKNTLTVCLLEKTKEQGGKIWRFSGAETKAPLESILLHVIPERPLTRHTMKKAWKELDFVVGVDDFVRTSDELCVTLDLGGYDSDTSDDEEYIPESSSGSEEESDEEFDVAAIDDSGFVAETHEIVEAWDNWEPKTAAEKRFKSVVDRIEAREMRKADDRAFARGEAAPDFRRPTKRRRKT